MRGVVYGGLLLLVGCVDAATQLDAVTADEGSEPWSLEHARAELASGTPSTSSSFGFRRGPIWLRARADAPGFLEVGLPQLDQLDVYVGDAHYRFGDHFPFSARPLRQPVYAVPIDAPGEVIVRAQSTGALAVPLRLWAPDDFDAYASDLHVGLGAYYAFLFALAFYNLFLFASLRLRAYGYYFGWIAGVALSQASFMGHTAMYLWPNSPVLADAMPAVAVALSAASGCLFVDAMLDARRLSRRASLALRGTAAVLFAIAVLLFVDYGAVILALPIAGFTSMAVIITAVVVGVRARNRAAYFLAFGALSFLPFYFLFALANQGVLQTSFLTLHAFKIGTCIEALILAFALADRVRVLEGDKLEAQRALSVGLLQAQDEERRRIARELHDGVGQELSVLAGELGGSSAEAARHCIDDLRRLSHDLHPDRLERLGLRAACERAVETTLDASGLEYDHELEDVDSLLSDAQALHVYRILQEALRNVVQHAEASLARVRLGRRAETLELIVEDDGLGIDAGSADGLGLSSMRERARAAGGRLTLAQREGGGTRVVMKIPVTHA